MPEPMRARHLVAWCCKRAGDAEIAARTDKKKSADGEQRTVDGDKVIAGILDDFGAALGKGLVDTNVFSKSVSIYQGLVDLVNKSETKLRYVAGCPADILPGSASSKCEEQSYRSERRSCHQAVSCAKYL